MEHAADAAVCRTGPLDERVDRFRIREIRDVGAVAGILVSVRLDQQRTASEASQTLHQGRGVAVAVIRDEQGTRRNVRRPGLLQGGLADPDHVPVERVVGGGGLFGGLRGRAPGRRR